MQEKKWLLFLLFIPAVIAMFFGLPLILINLGIQAMPYSSKPEITYGEFPFRLEYEIDGQYIVFEDTLVCEYGGISADEGRGKFRSWKSHLISGNDKLVLLKVENPVENWMGTPLIQIIFYDPGAARYYMGDMGEGVSYVHGFPNASIYEEYEDGSTKSGTINAKEMYDLFKIKLIDWKYTQPIKNFFS